MEFVLLLPVLLAIILKVNANWIKCSEKWCPFDRTKCQDMDLKCKCDKKGFIYRNESALPFQMTFNEVNGLLKVTGKCDPNFPLETLLKLWTPPLSSLKIEKMIIEISDENMDSDEDDWHSFMGPRRRQFGKRKFFRKKVFYRIPRQLPAAVVVMNISLFPPINSLITLELINECVENVHGNISDVFPRIQYLKIVLHQLKTVPENLRWLPNLEKVDLSNNEIEMVDNDDFRGLPKLQDIQLFRNNIDNLPEDFLSENSELNLISLGHNQLKSIPRNLLRNKPNLKKLALHYNQLETLPDDLLRGINKLNSLTLNRNKIRSFAPDFFQHTEIDNLVLYANLLTEVPKVKAIRQIDLRRNRISTLILPLHDLLPGAEVITLSGNCINNVTIMNNSVTKVKRIKFVCEKCCFETIPVKLATEVRELYISSNNISKFSVKDFKEIYADGGPDYLDLRYNRITTIDVDVYRFVENISTLFSSKNISIQLEDNPMICDCGLTEGMKNNFENPIARIFDLRNWRCKFPSSQYEVDVRDLNVEKFHCDASQNCPSKCTCSESRLKTYIIIDCSGLGLSDFPSKFSNKDNYDLILKLSHNNIRNLPPKSWPLWKNVIEFDLSFNKLESVANLIVTPSLKTINLDRNDLTHLESSIFDIFGDRLGRSVDLSGNPWQCSCDMKRLRDVAATSPAKLVNKAKTNCRFNNEIFSFYDVEKFCFESSDQIVTINKSPVVVIAVPVVAAIVIIMSISLILFIRFKLELKYFLFTKGWCLRFVTEEDVDADKTYDAFISYSGADGEWVRDVLVAGLENEEPVYKLCLHERDWLAGELIPEQIVSSVERSRRTIIVLTEEFLSSSWSQIEFNVAYHQAFEDGVRRLIVVVPNEMPNLDNVREDLRAYLATTTYLEANKPHFWRKLRCSMPRVNKSV